MARGSRRAYRGEVITGVHALLYSDDPPATRAFFSDVVGWPSREHDESGPGWLIFGSGPSELGVHPTSWPGQGQTTTVPVHHSVSLVTDDVAAEAARLRQRGAEIDGDPQDMGFGLGVMVTVPGAGQILLYQPAYEPSFDL